MAQRVLAFTHAASPGTRKMIFGDRSEPSDSVDGWDGRIDHWMSGPEPPCQATVRGLAGNEKRDSIMIIDGFRGCDFGTWAGLSADQVQREDPQGLAAWLHDAHAVPHQGESPAQLIGRVGRVLDSVDWSQGLSGLVVPPLVQRGLIVSVLGAPPEAIFSIDTSPLSTAMISRSTDSWRLQLRQQPQPGVLARDASSTET